MILALGAMVASCTPDNNGNEGAGDGKNRIVLDFEGDYWTSLIDNPQYNGELLYKQEGYSWYDEATDLYSTVNELWYTAAYWNGGLAASNYYTTDYEKGLQLYSSGVMIMENCEDLLPEHFRFVRGIVDSQDLSLNISREMLQHNRQLTIIARNIEKKIKGELKNMLENDREKYEEFYSAFGRQLKYGTVSDYGAHKESCQDLLLFLSAKEGRQVSLKEYVEAMAEGQEKIYYASGENAERLKKLPQVETLLSKGYDVLLFTEDVDEFIPQTLVSFMEKSFCNAASEDLGLQSEEEKKALEEKSEEKKGFLTFIKETLGENVKEVRFSSNLGSQPAAMVPEAGMSFEMERYFNAVQPELGMKAKRILELNVEHNAFTALENARFSDPDKAKKYAQVLLNQAKLIAGLPIEDPSSYTDLLVSLFN